MYRADKQAERSAPLPPVRTESSRTPRLPPQTQPSPIPSMLDRSVSHRLPSTQHPKQKALDRSQTTRTPGSSRTSPSHGTQDPSRHRYEQHGHPAGHPGNGVVRHNTQGSKPHTGQQEQGTARRREKTKDNAEVVRQLQSICTPGDPNAVYRNLQKVGQGYVFLQ